MTIFEQIRKYPCEKIIFHYNEEVGLKCIVAIDHLALKPYMGGTRFWNYPTEEDAVIDALRLAKAMTFKIYAAGLNAGGAKGVIIGDPHKDKSEALLRAYAEFVNTFKDPFITGEDVGIYPEDCHIMRQVSKWIIVGDPSFYTARGVIYGMEACAEEIWNTRSLNGLTVAVQGVGKVGYYLVKELNRVGADIIVSDINPRAIHRIAKEFDVKQVSAEEIYDVECDIFAPCALGGILNDETIARLKCKVVAGCANNQLKEERHGRILHDKGILYAPDYIINAGGLMYVWAQVHNLSEDWLHNKLSTIRDSIRTIISRSKAENKPTNEIANEIVIERIARALKRAD